MSSTLVQDHFFSPRNVGDLGTRGHNGRTGSLSCGAVVNVSIRVDESQTLVEIKFKAAGCSALVAAASLLTDTMKGKTTAEAALLAQKPLPELSQALIPNGTSRLDCAALANEALLSAITQYCNSVREEWEGDEALICACFGVSEGTIERKIRKLGLSTVREVIRACRAGGGCRSCWPLIEDTLAAVSNGK